MGFFGNKKPSKEIKSSKDASPNVDSYNSSNQDIKFPEFPSYEDTTSDIDFDSIKEEVTEPPKAEDFAPKETFDIPQREKKPAAQQSMPDIPKDIPQSGFNPVGGYESQSYSQSTQYAQN